MICNDCASCTGNGELARPLGRDQDEVRQLAGRCPACGHRWHRHEHGLARSAMPQGVELVSGPPPEGSPLAALLDELGEGPKP
jgi:hypothetical protein